MEDLRASELELLVARDVRVRGEVRLRMRHLLPDEEFEPETCWTAQTERGAKRTVAVNHL